MLESHGWNGTEFGKTVELMTLAHDIKDILESMIDS